MDSEWIDGALGDTINLSPAYIKGTATKENPYGTPFIFNPGDPGAVANAAPTEVRIVMEFDDYPGGYVNHCHILFHEDAGMMMALRPVLFHEDAGMMMALRPVLNTKYTWLGLDSNDNRGQVDLFRASNLFATSNQSISLTPYGTSFKKGIEVASADVNYKFRSDPGNQNVTDNVTDVITIQQSLEKASDKFTIKVFDGATLNQEQEGAYKFEADYDLQNNFTQLPNTNVFEVIISGTDPNAAYGLTKITGRIYGTIDQTGKGTFNSDPTVFGITGKDPGFVALQSLALPEKIRALLL